MFVRITQRQKILATVAIGIFAKHIQHGRKETPTAQIVV
jgi:hypothetical protein